MQLINFLIWSCISILLIGHIRESMRGRLSVRMSLWSRMAYHSSTTLLLFVVDDKCMLLRWWSNLYWWLWNLLPRRVRWDTNLHINPINDVIRQTVKFPIRFIFFYGLSPVASDILPSRARVRQDYGVQFRLRNTNWHIRLSDKCQFVSYLSRLWVSWLSRAISKHIASTYLCDDLIWQSVRVFPELTWIIDCRWGRIGRHESSPHSNVLQAATVPVVSDWQGRDSQEKNLLKKLLKNLLKSLLILFYW